MLTACGNIALTALPGESGATERYTALIGYTMDEVYDQLGLKTEDYTVPNRGLCLLKQEEPALDQSFEAALLFEVENDRLYGFRYALALSDADTAGVTIRALYDQLVHQYGTPDTDLGIASRVSAYLGDLTAFLTGSAGQMHEEWHLDELDHFGVRLTVSTRGSAGGITINLQYQISAYYP